MPRYGFRCVDCGATSTSERFARIGEFDGDCPVCGGRLQRRVSSPMIVRGLTWGFQPHFNNSVGRVVSSPHEMREALKHAAEKETLATGVAHEYTMVDPRDDGLFRVSDEARQINEAVNRGVVLEQPTPAGISAGEGGWRDPPKEDLEA